MSTAGGRAGGGVGGGFTVENFLTTQKLSLYFRTTTKEHWGGKQILTAKDWCEVGFGHLTNRLPDQILIADEQGLFVLTQISKC